MSGPALWILVPMAVGAVSLILLSERGAAWAGGITCLALAALALLVPIDQALLIGSLSFKVGSTASLLGRSIIIPPADAPFLALLFGTSALWFLGAEAAGVARRLVPLGMVILGLLIGSLAVQPFLYAAIMIEMAALVAIPLLGAPGQPPARAVIKFLIYETLGMPCLLLAGWLLAGVETSPGDPALTIQATVMLGMGFALALAVFPLNDWMPGLMEASEPYLAGFLLWLFPVVIVIFGLSFLDSYAWLRTSTAILNGLRVMGLLMLLSGGAWSALERNAARLLGHAAIAETGLMLIAMSLTASSGDDLVFPLLIPRGAAMILWALALSVLGRGFAPMDATALKGMGRTHPWAVASVVLSALSVAGFPLLAGFPDRIDLWDGLGATSILDAVWFLVGMAGLTLGGLRQLAAVIGESGEQPIPPQESVLQRGMLGAGIALLVILGLFPRITELLTGPLPLMFEHLAR